MNTKELEIQQELLKYFPNVEEAKQILEELGLSDDEINERLNCTIDEILIYQAAHEIIDQLASFSDDILNKFASILGVDQDNHKFKFKTEFLFRAVYFLRKKAYGQYIIEREGELIQEISQSGFGVKSDVPELTNQMIQHLFKVIFYTNGDTSLILRAVDMWKSKFENLIKQRSTMIGIPCGFNKSLSEYKNLNDCIRGMLLYNTLVGQEVFKPGTKGYKLYITNIDIKKLGLSPEEFMKRLNNFCKQYLPKKKPKDILTRIVIPDEFETIPDWIVIDKETTMDKIFVSKVNEALDAMGINISQGQDVALLDLF